MYGYTYNFHIIYGCNNFENKEVQESFISAQKCESALKSLK